MPDVACRDTNDGKRGSALRRGLITLLGLFHLILGSVYAQPTDPALLKNWLAPLSWQPTAPQEVLAASERAIKAGLSPGQQIPDGTAQGVLVAITPCRLVDTRSSMPLPYGAGASTALAWTGGSTHSISAPGGSCSLPAAMAYSANITVWAQPSGTILKWLSVCPTGTATATCSATATVTGYSAGPASGTAAIVSNSAVIPASAAGSFDVYVTDSTWVIIDVNGYFVSPNALSLGAGTAASPSLTFSGDSTSGIYSSGTGGISIATTGTSRLNVTSVGVGIGSAPAYPLDVLGDINLIGTLRFQGTPTFAVNTSLGNTAAGSLALGLNSAGANNTAVGYYALALNSSGSYNIASGGYTLHANSTGNYNTAHGYGALQSNTSGSCSTASGYSALANSTGAGYNTAHGAYALSSDTIGQDNTATGYSSLGNTTSGSQNSATGYGALYANRTGSNNTAAGFETLYLNTGSNNTALGYLAGYQVGSGNYNIHIGSQGVFSDNATIRIGTPGTQTAFFAAGIRGATTGNNDALPVIIDSNGQLGTINSSRRFKEDIRDMGDSSLGLMRLRPVTFRYKKPFGDGSKPIQYGLIAEEVAEVYPELVAHSADGQIESVKYQVLGAMLLNEMQRQAATLAALEERIDGLEEQIQAVNERFRRSKSRLEEPKTEIGKSVH